ncbi:MAG: DNA-3-methyladenine glycosylase 2 family protein [Clostridia bacterium]|nr:DNA-3-methyladenine glycosylase 2 family protein [Clostridia bacterium]
MFDKKAGSVFGKDAITVSGLGDYSLEDTLECGQCFRAVELCREGDYVEYLTVVGEKLVFVGQKERGELIFFGADERDIDGFIGEYFALGEDYAAIKSDILSRTDSEFLHAAADAASGIRILRQDPWEALFSFIISQNNNIPRIKKIIRSISAAYGENLAERSGISECPLKAKGYKNGTSPLDTSPCRECGICYTFPSAEAVNTSPEKLLDSHPGFRYKYLTDAAAKVLSGEVDLEKIKDASDYSVTLSELQKIKGVGEKVASCTALFAFSNLNAFPVDVWMKRAIDEYFGGNLDSTALGEYAGVAQQYIFHYIRMLAGEKN